jgi:ribosome-associated translation inhibitor RaiA
MKITYSHTHGDHRQALEEEAKPHIKKLEKLLKHYEPDLVHLHGSIEKQARKTEFSFSLNLILPTGTLHAKGLGEDVPSCARAAFSEIERSVKKHQEKLRKDYLWKRKRGRGVPKLSEAPSSD